MNLDKILLNEQQSNKICEPCKHFKYCEELYCDKHLKSQCLKLMAVLKKDCCHGLVGIKVGQCSECMSEIEKLLKEQND